MSGRIKHLTTFALATAALAACAPETPMEPAIVAQKAALLARNAGLQTAVGAGFAGGQDSTLRRLSSALSSAKEELGPALPTPVPSPLLDILMKNPFLSTLFDSKSPQTLEQKMNEVSIGLEKWVKERLLAAPNLETKTEDTAVYLLKADPTCRPLAAPGVPLPPIDEGCKASLEKSETRVHMKAILDGVALRFVVGPQQLEVSQVTVRLDGLEWRADLSKSEISGAYLDALLNGRAAQPSQFKKLAGKTLLSVKKDATTGVSIGLSILEPLDIIKMDEKKADVFSLKSAASTLPVLSLSGEKTTQTLVLQLMLGATELGSPWDPNGAGAANTDYQVAFTSVQARGKLLESARELDLSEVSLAGYTESVKGKKTLGVDVNPSTGGKLALRAQIDQAGVPRFEVNPKLEIVGAFDMSAVAGDFTKTPKPYLPNETFNLVLDGGGGAGRANIVTKGGQFAGVEVGAGSLKVTSTKATAPVQAPLGKCLTRTRTPAAEGHPLLKLLAVVDCPANPTPTTGGTR